MDNIERKLYELLCEDLKDRLENGEEIVTKDGEVVRVRPKANTLNVIRQFLKDNNIESDANAGDSPLHRLLQAGEGLPFDPHEVDEDAQNYH